MSMENGNLKPDSRKTSWSPLELQSTVVERYERTAHSNPTAIAVENFAGRITYGDLNRSSNSIAHGLIDALGMERSPVAILLPPGQSFFATFIAILKSGKICLPLDVRNPPVRLQAIIKNAQPEAVLVSDSTAMQLAAIKSPVRQLDVDRIGEGQQETNPEVVITPKSPGAIYYTSGSTGEPKGVLRNHDNMLHHAMTYSLDHDISSIDHQSFLYSAQSGASMPDMLGALLNGAALMPFDVWRHSVAEFADWLRDQRISLLHLPVSVFRLLLDFLPKHELLPDLRAVLVGGEAVFRSDILRGREIVSEDCVFVHQLSSTETNYITRYFIPREIPLHSDVLSVGYPARDKHVFIRDENGLEVEQGSIGEICVESRFLSSGYWRDPSLTLKKFRLDPDEDGKALYKTGDLGKIEADGNLRYIGREDMQVRIRGYRVELAEIESALQALSPIRLAVVKPYAKDGAEKDLVAYVIASDPGSPLNIDAIRSQLKQVLPEYMLPSNLIQLDEFPLLSTGKIDRDLLPHPEPRRPLLGSSYLPPRDSYEKRLVQIWEQVLGVIPVGVRDTFFALGGSSLDALRLLARIAEEFGENLPQASLLQSDTIEQQAVLLLIKGEDRPTARIVGIQTSGDRPPFFCISPRTVDVLAYRDFALALGGDQPFYALYAVDLPSRTGGMSRIEHHASTFVEDVLRFAPDGPIYLGGYSNGGIVALEIAHQLQAHGRTVDLLVLFDVYGPGYRKMLPFVPRYIYKPLQILRRLQQMVENFGPWIRHHKQVLSRLYWKERLLYIVNKTNSHLRWWVGRGRRSLARIQYRHGTAPSVASQVVGKSYRDHLPKPYEGRVALFRASRQPLGIRHDLFMGWKNILRDVNIYEVPGHHDSIFFPPRIEHLVGAFKRALKELDGKQE
ncbi:MAG: hypothetical protein E4G99_04675 [Anaerolineales bacterium]|nr:MAG: hypothetical protein E4G99_04675 [Anaerolineales bacterium]